MVRTTPSPISCCNFEGQTRLDSGVFFALVEHQGVIDLGHLFARELDVHNRADALNDGTLTHVESLND